MLSTLPVLVTDDGRGVAAHLAKLLRQQGIPVDIGTEPSAAARQLIFLGGLQTATDPPSCRQMQLQAFELAKKFSRRAQAFVTVQDTGGGFSLSGHDRSQGWLGGLSALVKTAGLEWPEAKVKAIDIDWGQRSAADVAAAIADELLNGGTELEVALAADGSRSYLTTAVLCRVPGEGSEHLGRQERGLDTVQTHLDADLAAAFDGSEAPVLIASGGARGVTAACLIALAAAIKPRLALFGRSPLTPEPAHVAAAVSDGELKKAILQHAKMQGRLLTPAALAEQAQQILAQREVRANLEALQAAGAEVLYLTVDGRDRAAVAGAVSAVRERWGPITGLIHGAGVLADRLIQDKTPAQWATVYDTKVLAAQHLLEATASEPLRLIGLFSSIAARTGNPGQCDYATANAVLNKVALHEARRRAGACLVKALNFGPWDGGMVNPGLKAHFAKQHVALIPLAEGAAWAATELLTPGPVELVFAASADLPKASLQLQVSKKSHGFIASHQVKGTPVLPMALVAAWFLKAAPSHDPTASFALEDLTVLRGVALTNFADGVERLQLDTAEGDDGLIVLKLFTEGAQRPCYQAIVRRVETSTEAATGAAPRASPEQSPWSAKDVYNQVLFHGPQLQIIDTLQTLDALGSAALFKSPDALGWQSGEAPSDVAVLDGVLQLALVQGHFLQERAFLPTKIRKLRLHAGVQPQPPLRCELWPTFQKGSQLICDAQVVTADGRMYMTLEGIEAFALPLQPRNMQQPPIAVAEA